MSNRCVIKSIAQVSCQQPLCDEWMDSPIHYEDFYARAIEPNSKDFISASEARRLSKILKRTICTSLSVISESGINQPDAIITGTGMGCLENSEKFLIDIAKFGESCLKPTLFMQSTHNTISSLIGIKLHCHGYNNTYSQKGISFDSALLDAWLQIKSGTISSALVGGHDEITPIFSEIEKKNHPEYSFISESSVAAMLVSDSRPGDNSVEVEKVEILYRPDIKHIKSAISDSNVLMLGLNGNPINDRIYLNLIETLDNKPMILKFKYIFGENFASSAIGFYSAARILETGKIPEFMIHNQSNNLSIPGDITLVNHSGGNTWSIIKLKK